MNTELHITERIDKALNVLNSMQLHGYAQWNPVCETMNILASISQDIMKYEAEQKKESKPVKAADFESGNKNEGAD